MLVKWQIQDNSKNSAFKSECLGLPTYQLTAWGCILRAYLHELFTNLTNLSCSSLHFFPSFYCLLQSLFPHKVFSLFPHFLQRFKLLSKTFPFLLCLHPIWGFPSLISFSSFLHQFNPQCHSQMKFLELLRRRLWPFCPSAEEGAEQLENVQAVQSRLCPLLAVPSHLGSAASWKASDPCQGNITASMLGTP